MAEHWRHLNRLQDVDFENDSFISIAETVYYQLKDRYSEWIFNTCNLTHVLRAILTHTSLSISDSIPGTLHVHISGCGTSNDKILSTWNFKYYREHQVIGDPTIPPIANIGNISNTYCILPCYQPIKLRDIHAGADHNFSALLSLEKTIQREITKSSPYSNNGKLICDNHEIDLKNTLLMDQVLLTETHFAQFIWRTLLGKFLKSKAVTQEILMKSIRK
ncbi:3946_t:CDS:2 [Funneliformis caledonium]|uniref:3946_t:CDS:1 n=1 Tax=Funneliformis caledonium TaxID=1117310 RepID=A0A9N8VMF8_9GLOM|nr:3946_t:CDS:2 [Funneliformis caledonium]